jgi:hypothetical protein
MYKRGKTVRSQRAMLKSGQRVFWRDGEVPMLYGQTELSHPLEPDDNSSVKHNTMHFSPNSQEHQVQDEGEPTRIVNQKDAANEEGPTDYIVRRPVFGVRAGSTGNEPKGPPSAMPGPDGPSSTTMGGTATKGLHYDLVGSYPIEGDTYAYWPRTSSDGYQVFRTQIDVQTQPPEMVGSYPLSSDSFYHSDQTVNYYRVWRVSRATNDLGATTSAGVKSGLAGAKVVNDRAMQIRAINQRNERAWKKE